MTTGRDQATRPRHPPKAPRRRDPPRTSGNTSRRLVRRGAVVERVLANLVPESRPNSNNSLHDHGRRVRGCSARRKHGCRVWCRVRHRIPGGAAWHHTRHIQAMGHGVPMVACRHASSVSMAVYSVLRRWRRSVSLTSPTEVVPPPRPRLPDHAARPGDAPNSFRHVRCEGVQQQDAPPRPRVQGQWVEALQVSVFLINSTSA